MRFLGISGSLRAQSTNTNLLRAMSLLATPDVQLMLFEELEQIPPFNPDKELITSAAGPVFRLRTAVQQSDAIIISTPEYAHGLPGSLKNALDWMVGTGELYRKPVTLANASSRGHYAQAALREVLIAMDARLISQTEVTIELSGPRLAPNQIVDNPDYARALEASLWALRDACQKPAL